MNEEEKSELKSGRDYWRSLEELAGTPEFEEMLYREFPAGASEWKGGINRREFLRLMAGSLALAGVAGCAAPPATEKIVPYVERPEGRVPGEALFYATAMELGGWAAGLLVKSNEGRPTKVEGNPQHPFSLGATTAFGQAAVLELYDPDRSQAIVNEGQPAAIGTFFAELDGNLAGMKSDGGSGLRILSGAVTSPTLLHQRDQVLEAFPKSKWIQYEPAGLSFETEGLRGIFGKKLRALSDFSKAELVVSFEGDFLSDHPASLRNAGEYYRRRRESGPGRLYVFEGTPTVTGSAADHRFPVRSGRIERLVFALAGRLGIPVEEGELSAEEDRWLRAVLSDLERNRGKSLLIAGRQQSAAVHGLVQAMNLELGNVGGQVSFIENEVPGGAEQLSGLKELVGEMESGAVETILILGGNPVFDAPADFGFEKGLKEVRNSIHWSLYQDETSRACRWHIPAAHFLESWSDSRAWDGTVSIVQPLIAPLYSGVPRHEVVAALLEPKPAKAYDIVRNYWEEQKIWPEFEKGWERSLHEGLIAGTALPAVSVEVEPGRLPREAVSDSEGESLELIFRADPSVWDGRFANNGWLQELPRPLTKLTWENAVLVSPGVAKKSGLENGDRVRLRFREREVSAPVWILPGQAESSVTLHFGYGRTEAGQVGNGTGFDVYRLRPSDSPWFGSGLKIEKIGGKHRFASTQTHHNLDGRDILRTGTVEEFRRDPEFVGKMGKKPPEKTLYKPEQHAWDGAAWGMSIDLGACFGCNICMIACQAENNIPVVGKKEVLRHREMHWIRVDTYFSGTPENPMMSHQAVPCMHCENAPCEVVCPVAATVHSVEGLNDQVYNRCIGTRYCSNNCPYKVRRFNFLQYSDLKTPVRQLLHNPNVTVRSRGVMEKCTYCVQRINAARIVAKRENRRVRDGEIVPACAAACPAGAIVFGDINDSGSHVSELKRSPLNYAMLGELNTRPRTTYLAQLRNPNPELDDV